MASYTIELSEKQIRLVEVALEEYFRLRMGQDWDFCDALASLKHNLDPKADDFDVQFSAFIHRRDHLRAIMTSFFRVAFEPDGLTQKSEDMLIAEDIWDVIRCALGHSRWDRPLHVSEEPMPRVVKHETDSKGKGNL